MTILVTPSASSGGPNQLLTALELEDADGQYVSLMVPGSRGVTTADGLVGMEAREQVRPRPGRHGVIQTTRYRDSPPVTITGHFYDADAAAVWEEYNEVARACAAAVRADRNLRWSGGPALDLVETRVRVVSLKPPLEAGPNLIRYQLVLRASDPRSFAQTASSAVGDPLSASGGGKAYPYTYPRGYNPAGGGGVNFTIGGTDETPPVFRIYGQCSAPALRLASTGAEIVLTGEIEADRYIDVDVDARELRLDDGTVVNSLLDYEASTWFELPPGPDTVQMFAASFDATARVDVSWRDAYA